MSITAPTDITTPTCRLWLQGDRGLWNATSGGTAVSTNGSSVLRWADQSGNGMDFTEATNPPTLATAGVNGVSSLSFNGTSSILSLANASAGALNTMQAGTSFTLVFAMQPQSVASTMSLFSKGGGGDKRLFFLLSQGTAHYAFGRFDGAYAYAPSSGVSGEIAVSTPYVITYSYLNTGTNVGTETFRINGQLVAIRSGTVPAIDTVNAWIFSFSSFRFNGYVAMALAYDGLLSTSQTADVEAYAASYLGLTQPTYDTGYKIVTGGDSRTFGQGSTGGQTWPAQMKALLTGRNPQIVNIGLSGQTVATINTNKAKLDGPAVAGSSVPVIYTIYGGTNDFQASATGATTYANLQAICTAMKAANTNVKIVVCTDTPSSLVTGSKETERLAYNSAIRSGFAGATLACDAVADLAGDARLQTTSNGTYFTDGTHFTNTGYGVIASIIQTQVAPLLPSLASLFKGSFSLLGIGV